MTLPAGTVASHFCYDEQDRLTWAGTTGTPPCTGSAITGTTISSAQYAIPYGYDSLDRLTTSWNGSYSYGDSAHLHAVTAIGSSYSATYDAAGNMTCRAPSSSTTCTGSSPTGAQLGYDNEGRLVTWQNTPTSPTSTAKYLYDGEGERVESQVTNGSTTTTTVYVGGLQDVVTTGGTTTTTSYYALGDAGMALSTNGSSPSYQATDHLGSPAATLDSSGNVTGNRFYDPYGNGFASSGSMPGSYGFTGQHSDVGTTGLDYYHARYYDPTAGQFGSADTVRDGQSRYAYVQGKPETATDPSGHFCGEEAGCGDGNAVEATGFAGDFAAADATYTDEAATEAEAQVEAQVAEEAQAGEREGPGGAEAVARAELAASDSPELLDEEMRGDELQRSAEERDTQRTPPTNPTKPPTTQPTQPTTTQPSTTTSGSNEVILDTNSVYDYNQPGVQAQIGDDETPVITETTDSELTNNETNGTAGGTGRKLPMPRWAKDGTLPVVQDQYNPDIARDIRARMNPQKDGVDGDVIIGTTAITTGRPLITGDRELYDVLRSLYGPGAARYTR